MVIVAWFIVVVDCIEMKKFILPVVELFVV